MPRSIASQLFILAAAFGLSLAGSFVSAQQTIRPVVPGTGVPLPKVGDDFEAEDWIFDYNHPKSSEKIDEQTRYPAGFARNGRWYEGPLRGTPDLVKRIETPPGGLEGSKGAMLIRTVHSGIPGRPSYTTQQDDLIADVEDRLGGALPVSQQPNVVTRVFIPPFEQWEQRNGSSFAFRIACDTYAIVTDGPGKGKWGRENYWPGMFIDFQSKASGRHKEDGAVIRIRANNGGGDFAGPRITKTGWWTLGMSVTSDGAVHFYAKPGLEDLEPEDRLASTFPYGYRCQRMKTFFYNVCSADDGRTWSTPWVVDDPKVYYVRTGVASQPGSTTR